MKVKTWIPLVLAVVLGLAAAVLERSSLSKGRAKPDDTNLVATVTAAHDIQPGQKITAADLAVTKMSADAVPTRIDQSTSGGSRLTLAKLLIVMPATVSSVPRAITTATPVA